MSFSIGTDGVNFTLGKDIDEESLLSESYRLPEKLGDILSSLIVCIDEFQAYRMVSEKLPGSIRGFFQTTPNVIFVFSGSMRHIIEEPLFQSKGLMYHCGIKLDLSPFRQKEVTDYLVGKFESSGKRISSSTAERFYEITKGHPYCVQIMAYELCNTCLKEATEKDLDEALNQLISRERHTYDLALDVLGQKYVRKVLIIIASNRDIFSVEALREFEIPNPSVANKSVKRLIELGFVKKLSRGNYEIIDPIFEEYILRRFS